MEKEEIENEEAASFGIYFSIFCLFVYLFVFCFCFFFSVAVYIHILSQF